MNINSLKSFSQNAYLSFKDRFSLSPLHKQIIAVALVTFCILAARYAASKIWKALEASKEKVLLNQILASGKIGLLLTFLRSYKGKVEYLNLHNFYHIDDEILRSLTLLCPHLHTLILGNCNQITDQALDHLQALPLLNNLQLEHNCYHISDAGLEKLKNIANLTQLRLGNCPNITRRGLEHLASLNDLDTLELKEGFGIDGRDLEIIAKCLKLTTLHLEGFTQITDGDLNALTPLTQLHTLNLQGCTQITDQGLHIMAVSCPLISSLNLSRCPQISNTAPEFLSKFSDLNDLKLSNCSQIDDKSIDNFISANKSKAPALQKLHISHCKGVNDKMLESLQQFTHLKDLNISFADQITDDGLKFLPSNIKHLTLPSCKNITDAGIKNLEKSSNSLIGINLDNCKSITDKCFDTFRKFPLLILLTLCKCSGITKDGVDDFRKDFVTDSQGKLKFLFWTP